MTSKSSTQSDTNLGWIKSSYSTSDGPSCVEVAATPGMIYVRDSKLPDGLRLTLTPTTWATFLPYAAGH